jgi:pilus assembly protein Flp/PilA
MENRTFGSNVHITEFPREGTTMLEFIRNITSRRNEDGASAVEYGLLVAGIAALIVAIVFLFGGVIKGAFSSTCGQISSKGANANATC